MPYDYLETAITPSVRQAQARMGADRIWRDFDGDRPARAFTEAEAQFIAEQDSLYLATVSETGWPYVQHRGGPPGFLKVIDPQTLAFADYRGNRQYISTGNLAANPRASLILVDYAHRRRLKIYAEIESLDLDADPGLTRAVTDAGYRAKLERVFRLRLVAFDWNCPQHIPQRLTEAAMTEALRPVAHRIAQLEAENAALRARLDAHGGAT